MKSTQRPDARPAEEGPLSKLSLCVRSQSPFYLDPACATLCPASPDCSLASCKAQLRPPAILFLHPSPARLPAFLPCPHIFPLYPEARADVP